MPVSKRDPMTEKMITDARKMPGYPKVEPSMDKDDPDGVSGMATSMPESHPGAPAKLPAYGKSRG